MHSEAHRLLGWAANDAKPKGNPNNRGPSGVYVLMASEFHIFARDGERVFTIRRPGIAESRDFPSLGEATRHLRGCAQDSDACVVIYDDQGKPNRIPLKIGAL